MEHSRKSFKFNINFNVHLSGKIVGLLAAVGATVDQSCSSSKKQFTDACRRKFLRALALSLEIPQWDIAVEKVQDEFPHEAEGLGTGIVLSIRVYNKKLVLSNSIALLGETMFSEILKQELLKGGFTVNAVNVRDLPSSPSLTWSSWDERVEWYAEISTYLGIVQIIYWMLPAMFQRCASRSSLRVTADQGGEKQSLMDGSLPASRKRSETYMGGVI